MLFFSFSLLLSPSLGRLGVEVTTASTGLLEICISNCELSCNKSDLTEFGPVEHRNVCNKRAKRGLFAGEALS